MDEPRWTLDELAERVGAALAVDYDGQPSGRVRDVPDRRAIRWYTTIGLVDRPLAHRGRTALYGPRHLLQLVAVKRLQARGMPLVAIQRELAGATDAQLAQVARIPAPADPARALAAAAPGSTSQAVDGPGHPDSASATLPHRGAESRAGSLQAVPVAPAVARPARSTRAGFWRERPATAADAPAEPGGIGDGEVAPGDPGATLRGVRLGAGATLLLEPGRELSAADLRAVLEAARPLLAVLRARGLAGPPPASPAGPAPGTGRRPGPEPRREQP
jgi:DNA-binding transcriptional MerR regulator